MISKPWHILFILFLCTGMASQSMAADCGALKKSLKAEKSLKKKRSMLQNIIHQCPEDPVINYKYALSLERFRKYDKALGYYQKAVQLNPKMGKAHAGMGDVCIYLGLLEEAIAAYQAAAKLMPEDKRTGNRLVRLEAKKKALTGHIVSVGEYIRVMDHRGKIPSNTPLLLTGPVLQYKIAFVPDSVKLLPTGIRQLAIIGQAMQNDALKKVRFEIAVYVDSADLSPGDALKKSKLRAEAIRDQLVTNFLIDPKRLDIGWHGDSQPLAFGEFAGARSLNNRVEFKRLMAKDRF